jgi:beta-lactamase class A
MRLPAIALLAFSLLGAASPSPAPTVTPSIALAQSRLDTMLRTGHADPSWFSESFLEQIPASKVDEVIAELTKALGPYQSIELKPDRFVAHFAKGSDDVLIHLDADGKIDGLLFKPPVVATSSLDDSLRSLREQTGRLSYVIVVEGRSERAALNPSEPLAIGSAFKLAVLNALLDQIGRGSRHWSDILPLQSRWRSLPSGVLQKWPNGTPLTLATYAAEMISISDNTAADALVRLVGPNALKPYASGNDPFLTTRETFILKSNPGAGLRAAYLAAATPKARAAVLERVDSLPLPNVQDVLTSPLPAIEWHYSVRELCSLMRRVANLPLMSINPGVAEPSDFRHVAYKGGSDAGVLNLTTMVTTVRGTNVCFSATLNDSQHQVGELGFETAYSAVLRQLASL